MSLRNAEEKVFKAALTPLESAAAYKIHGHPLNVATWIKLKYPQRTLSKCIKLLFQ